MTRKTTFLLVQVVEHDDSTVPPSSDAADEVVAVVQAALRPLANCRQVGAPALRAIAGGRGR